MVSLILEIPFYITVQKLLGILNKKGDIFQSP